MKRLTALQLEQFKTYAADKNLNERTRRWFRLLIQSSEHGPLRQSDGNNKARRFIKRAAKSADPARLIFTKTRDGPYLEAAISRLPVETMYLAEVASTLNIAAEKVPLLLNGRLTRGCIERMAKGRSVTIAGLYFGMTVKLAVIQLVDEPNAPDQPDLSAGQLFFGSTTPTFAIGQAGIQTADLVDLEAALAHVPARTLGCQATAAQAAAVELSQIEQLRSALVAKPIDRTAPSRARTYCLIEYSGPREFRRQIEDLVASEITRNIEVVRSDFSFRLLTGMAHHDLLGIGVGYFPDLPWWCQMLNANAHSASTPFWEVRPPLEDLAILWERNRLRIRAAHSGTKLFSGQDPSEKDSRNTVSRTPLFPEHVLSTRLSNRFKELKQEGQENLDVVRRVSRNLIIDASAVLQCAHLRISGPEFADDVLDARGLVSKWERNGMGPNTLVTWHKDPHKTRKGLLRTTNRSEFLRQLSVGLALTQFSEKFIVGTSAEAEKNCFGELFARLKAIVAAAIESNYPAQAGGVDPVAREKFSAEKAHEVLLIVLRRARDAFQQALALTSRNWFFLVVVGKISEQFIRQDSPLRSFCPPAFEVPISALLADFTRPAPEGKTKVVSGSKSLKDGGKDTLYDILPGSPESDNADAGEEAKEGGDDRNTGGTPTALWTLKPQVLLNFIDKFRTDPKYSDTTYSGTPEKWIPDEDLRWDLTQAAIAIVQDLDGDECEINEFMGDLPKIIRDEAVYRLSRSSIYL